MTTPDCRSAAGFSLVEMMIVVGIGAVLMGVAVAQVGNTRSGTKGDGGMRVVLGLMNQARQTAIQQRRYVRVVFTTPNLMQVVEENTITATVACTTTCTTLQSALFEGNVQFGLVTSVTTDTPDAFGNNSAAFNGAPVAFGSATFVRFAPDGTLVNQNGVFINGTVFLAVPSTVLSQRAVTVLGATGRVRGYRWIGNQWSVV